MVGLVYSHDNDLVNVFDTVLAGLQLRHILNNHIKDLARIPAMVLVTD